MEFRKDYMLSPIIFAIFFTPIQHIFNKYPDVNYNLYADDIELHSNIESTYQLHNCLTDLHNWLTTNDLLLNSINTELINISTAKLNTEPAFPKIFINNIPIKLSDSITYFGVKFDDKSNFDEHILSLKQTTTYHVYNLYKLRPYINKNTAILLTHSLILSRQNYCNTLLTGQTKTTLKRLDAIINRIIRLIYKLQKYDYTTIITDLRLRLNWVITANSIDYKLLTILKKTLTYDQLHNLRKLLNIKTNCRKLRSSQFIILSLHPMPLNSVENKSFRHLAPNKWNHLPKILLFPTVTINMFKRKLKSFLLRWD